MIWFCWVISQGGANHGHSCCSHGCGDSHGRGLACRHASTAGELTKAPSLSRAQCDPSVRVIDQSYAPPAVGPKGNPWGALVFDPTTSIADILVDEARIHLLA